MAITEHSFSVPAATLFDTLANPYTYPQWLVGTRKIRTVSADWPQPASYFEHTVGFGPIAIPDRTTVREIDQPRIIEMLVRARPVIEAVVRFEVTTSPSGSTLRTQETPIGFYKLLSFVAHPLIRARNERSMKRLRSFIEDGAAPGTPITPSPGRIDEATHGSGVRRASENADDESPA